MFNLGDKVKDRITGLTGIVVAKTEWINGCVRFTIQPQKLKKDGVPLDTFTFDVEELVLVKSAVYSVKEKKKRTNGPMPSVGGTR